MPKLGPAQPVVENFYRGNFLGCLNGSYATVFADDTELHFSHRANPSTDIDNASVWLVANKLKLKATPIGNYVSGPPPTSFFGECYSEIHG